MQTLWWPPDHLSSKFLYQCHLILFKHIPRLSPNTKCGPSSQGELETHLPGKCFALPTASRSREGVTPFLHSPLVHMSPLPGLDATKSPQCACAASVRACATSRLFVFLIRQIGFRQRDRKESCSHRGLPKMPDCHGVRTRLPTFRD